MKPVTALSLLAIACATTVIAIPTPGDPAISSMTEDSSSGDMQVDAVDENYYGDLEKRVRYGPGKIMPGVSYIRARDPKKVDHHDQGLGDHPIEAPIAKREPAMPEGKGFGDGSGNSKGGDKTEGYLRSGGPRPGHDQKQGGQRDGAKPFDD